MIFNNEHIVQSILYDDLPYLPVQTMAQKTFAFRSESSGALNLSKRKTVKPYTKKIFIIALKLVDMISDTEKMARRMKMWNNHNSVEGEVFF